MLPFHEPTNYVVCFCLNQFEWTLLLANDRILLCTRFRERSTTASGEAFLQVHVRVCQQNSPVLKLAEGAYHTVSPAKVKIQGGLREEKGWVFLLEILKTRLRTAITVKST